MVFLYTSCAIQQRAWKHAKLVELANVQQMVDTLKRAQTLAAGLLSFGTAPAHREGSCTVGVPMMEEVVERPRDDEEGAVL